LAALVIHLHVTRLGERGTFATRSTAGGVQTNAVNQEYDSRMNAGLPVACIFRSTRTDHSEIEYQAWSSEMDDLVKTTPGYRYHFSFRDLTTGEGVTISYFDDLDCIARWRSNARHVEAQQLGRDAFYEQYTIQVVDVVREYQWSDPS
jgi:heme-degrading monooxygenase HmoA